MGLEDFFDQKWPEPDLELVDFIAKVQKPNSVERFLSRDGQNIRLKHGLYYLLHVDSPGSYGVAVRFTPGTFKAEEEIKQKGILLARSYLFGIPMLDLEDGFAYGVVPMLVLIPIGSQESYRIALMLLYQNKEAWRFDGILETAAELKKKRDALTEEDLVGRIYLSN